MKWKLEKLGDICAISSGGTPSRREPAYFEGTIPWAKISDIENANGYISETEEKITKEALSSINNRIFPPNTLLLAIYGSVGKVAITMVEMSTNQAILGIRPLSNSNIDLQYLKHWFSTIKEMLLDRAVGGTLQNISLGIVKELPIPLPPLATQQKIAAILDEADALRRKDKALLAKYDELLQAVFYDMFYNKKHETSSARDLLKVIGGAAFKSDAYVDDGIPLIRIGTINKGYFDEKSLTYLPEDFAQAYNNYIVYPKDILITLTGTVGKDDYGNIFELPYLHKKYFLNQRVAKLQYDSSRIRLKYLLHLFKQPLVKNELTGVSRGVRQANISNEDIYNLTIPVPDTSLQQEFESIAENIEHQKSQIIQQQTHSEALFQSLMQRAFAGRLVG